MAESQNLLYGTPPAHTKIARVSSEEERELLLLCLEATMVLKHETDPDELDDAVADQQLCEVLRYFEWVRNRRSEVRAGRSLSPLAEGIHRQALIRLEEGLDQAYRVVTKLKETFEAEGIEWAGATRTTVENAWTYLAGAYHDVRDDILDLGPLDGLLREAEATDPAPEFPLPPGV